MQKLDLLWEPYCLAGLLLLFEEQDADNEKDRNGEERKDFLQMMNAHENGLWGWEADKQLGTLLLTV